MTESIPLLTHAETRTAHSDTQSDIHILHLAFRFFPLVDLKSAQLVKKNGWVLG